MTESTPTPDGDAESERAEFEADAATLGMTVEEYLKHWLFKILEDEAKMLEDEVALDEANEIVEPHLTGDDWKL
jgi:hypothetical protein